MTDDTTAPWSPQWIRQVRFPQRIRGYDEAEVHAFLEGAAAQLQRQRDVEASLRSEIARLEAVASNEEVQERAVALFSQAQIVADQLVADAVQHAQDMMSAARNQEREILGRAAEVAGSARVTAAPAAATPTTGEGTADVAYVNTYAKIVAVQLRSVVDALSEQVDKLTELPEQPAAAAAPSPTTTARTDAWAQLAETPASGTYTQSVFAPATPLNAENAPDESEPLIWASMMTPPAAREPGW